MTRKKEQVSRASDHSNTGDPSAPFATLEEERIPSRRILWVLLLLVAVLEIGFAWRSDHLPLVGGRLFYAPTEVADIVKGIDPTLRDCCRWFNLVDLGFIALYTALLVAWLRLLGRRCVLCCWVCSLGFVPGCCAAVESVGLAVLLASAAPTQSWAVWFVAFASPLKWMAAGLVATLIALLEVGLRQRGKHWLRWIQRSTPLAPRRQRVPLQYPAAELASPTDGG